MSDWTPEEIREALQRGDRVRLRALALDLSRAAEAGRVNFLYRRPALRRVAQRSRDEDVQDTMLALFDRGARVLLRFGDHPGFLPAPGALRRFVIGVTWNVLQRRYQDRRLRWEQLEDDLRSTEEYTRMHQSMDLQTACRRLSSRDQELFDLLYIVQLEPDEICRLRGIQRNALDAQRSRLLKRIIQAMRGDAGAGAKERDDD